MGVLEGCFFCARTKPAATQALRGQAKEPSPGSLSGARANASQLQSPGMPTRARSPPRLHPCAPGVGCRCLSPLLVLESPPLPRQGGKAWLWVQNCGYSWVAICGEGLRRALGGVPVAKVLQCRARTANMLAGGAASLIGEEDNNRAQTFWQSHMQVSSSPCPGRDVVHMVG